MKLKNILLLATFCISSLLSSTLYHIKLDGSGNFTTIQAGIDASVDADTVLVYPGTYFENLDFNGKNIMLCSQELTTGNSQFINSTIIDGQLLESCISVHNGESNAQIRGFSIQNGFGSQHWSRDGGGVQVYNNSSATIINCIIQNNRAAAGAALYARNGILNLSGLVVKNNSAHIGGAIYINDDSTLIFDPENLSSIYNNNAGKGADLYIEDSGVVNVIVDTFTVFDPSRFFAEYYGDSAYSFDIQHNWMELEPYDLYVAQNGNDINSGLTPNEPLRNICWAVRKIQADEQNPRNIYVSSGTYSWEENQQIFPIGCKEFVSICGEDMNNTIIFNDYLLGAINGKNVAGTIEFSNLSIQNSPDIESFAIVSLYEIEKVIMKNIKIHNNSNINKIFINEFVYNEYDNLIITDNTPHGSDSGLVLNNNAGYMKNCIISNNDNQQQYPLSSTVAMHLMAFDDFTLENCTFTGNHSSNSEGRIIRTANHNGGVPTIRFNSCLITENSIGSNNVCQNFNYDGLTEFNNSTIVNNTASGGFYSSALYNYGDINIRNTIMYNNTDYEVFMVDDTQYSYIYNLNVDNSNIKNGEAGIYNMNNVNIINWGEGNIASQPLFLSIGDNPYQLSELSPCIDAGTLDTTGLFLPPWDLLHHQRIWDGDGNGTSIIDMGCYEFGADSVGVHSNEIQLADYELRNYPNPFNPETRISFHIPESGKVKVEIYNIKGQKVKTMIDCSSSPGHYELIWNGTDENNHIVSSGMYFCLLKTPKHIVSKKMLLLK
ncbi:T9SS type A sorting domain-containing protein [Candidatus Cloacimonadota bacterium]